MYLLADINTKKLWNIPEEKYSGQLEILNSSIKSFVNSYVGIALTFNILALYPSFLSDIIFYYVD